MNILGVSCYFHDAAAALLQDGRLVAACEEERFTRVKHDPRFPEHSISFCLRQAGLRVGELDYVVFFEKPLLKLERILESFLRTAPRSWRVFPEALSAWLGDKLWIRERFVERLGLVPERLLFVEHHLSHAASAFFCSPFERAAVLTVDGVGERTTASIGAGEGRTLKLLAEQDYPHSLGLFYSAVTSYLGFEVNEGEYKVMGLAAYGRPVFESEMRRLLRVAADGAFELDASYFSYETRPDRSYNDAFEALLGPPRRPGSPFDPTRPEDRRFADIAASAQAALEHALVRMAVELHRRTGSTDLCLAGGVAFNGVANARLLRETPFKRLFVQPAAGDAGGALGAALYVWHQLLGRPRALVMDRADWGQGFGDEAVAACLDRRGVVYERLDEAQLLERAAERLERGGVVGWFQGRSEWGPRALGQRSILADPRPSAMKDRVNASIKFRESFRPFAPAALEEAAGGLFDWPGLRLQPASRFMQLVVPVRSESRAGLGAVTHIDGTARPQTVEREANPLFYRLIEAFGERTGMPVLLNTSFNLKGEPIVHTPEDALRTFAASGMDAAAFGGCWVERRAFA